MFIPNICMHQQNSVMSQSRREGYLQKFSRDVISKETHPAALGSVPCLKALFAISHVEPLGYATTVLVAVCIGRLVQIACCSSSYWSVPKACQGCGSLIGAERGNTVVETVF
jgi:hypothetical protein